MSKLALAESIIHAPFLKKLTDRTFLSTLGSSLGVLATTYAVWQTPGVSPDQKIQALLGAYATVGVVVSAWNHGAQKQKTAIAVAAVTPVAADVPVVAGK